MGPGLAGLVQLPFTLHLKSVLIWTLFLSLQSRAHPTEIMSEVYRALHELNIRWKKGGMYTVKCRWVAPSLRPVAPSHSLPEIQAQMSAMEVVPPTPSPMQEDDPSEPPETAPLDSELSRLVKFELQVGCGFVSATPMDKS